MKVPKAIEKVIHNFERLPGIGPKSAQRLGFYLLHVPQSQLDEFAVALEELKANTATCQTCFNIGDSEECSICDNFDRNGSVMCVVEDALDVIAFERGGRFKGVYHVLHGVIDPLNSIGPDDIFIPQLMKRFQNGHVIEEVILATNPTLEGEATAMYIAREIEKFNEIHPDKNIKVTRIGRGLPIGADIEYADEITLQRALEGRREF
jgi:recombination protein RecR